MINSSPPIPALTVPQEAKFNLEQPGGMYQMACFLQTLVNHSRPASWPFLILCIGTDRSTGDCLGPLTGSKLKRFQLSSARILGTLDEPVHATNLADTLDLIRTSYPNAFVLAVDACLGRLENVGLVTAGSGPLRPGAAVKKDLPPVGDAFVTGIVNVGGFMEHMVLQSTRLNLVMKMADSIAAAIAFTVHRVSLPAESANPAEKAPGLT